MPGVKKWPWVLGAVAVFVLLVYGTLFAGWFRDDIPTHASAENVTLEPVPVADGLDAPTLVTHAGDDRLWVVEQAGRIHVMGRDGADRRLWLDITDRVRDGGERGLLGLAFPPDHDASGTFYVHYSDGDGDTVLSRFHAPAGSDTADPDSEEVLLQQDQPYPNHNGGTIVFGPDGYLYMGLGDGGLAADPHGHGQDPDTILGAILRLDVSGDEAVGAPGNPFEDGGGDPRVWHYGLRNPWRFSFDAEGNLWIGDVGQQHIEEIDYAPAGEGGLNFGWVVYEGSSRYRSGEAPGHVPPVAEYDHDGGHCSVTGGHVWDHDDAGPLRGHYLFGDYCSGTVWSHDRGDGSTRIVARLDARISSFGTDADGRLYLVDHGGAVSRLHVE